MGGETDAAESGDPAVGDPATPEGVAARGAPADVPAAVEVAVADPSGADELPPDPDPEQPTRTATPNATSVVARRAGRIAPPRLCVCSGRRYARLCCRAARLEQA
ncbi:hypothetical protein [Embleya sp. NPDC005971]|uniref:hypothetical protein n=1 Tax=Embleya sp. NPDC005971 TaxID=3156724 RepID=UPI0033D39191